MQRLHQFRQSFIINDFYFKTSINTFYEEIQVKIPTLLANMYTCLKVNSNRNIYTQPRNTLFKIDNSPLINIHILLQDLGCIEIFGGVT